MSDDEEAQLLAAAAAAWAEQDTVEEPRAKKRKKSVEKDPATSNQSFSLHVTQLDFDAKEYDLRNYFVEKGGCSVTSVRFVYDRGLNDRKLFRGVAFVDVSDEESFRNALQLHHTTLLGRRINVRPTKTRDELKDIVSRTQEIVREKIKETLNKDEDEQAKKQPSPKGKRQREKDKRDRPKKSGPKTTSTSPKKKQSSGPKHSAPKHKPVDGDVKLTKKERNRKAAILLQRKRRK